MAAFKLDKDEVLAAIDRHDYGFLGRLPDEQRKAFAPPVLLRWLSTVRGPYADLMLMMVNDRANLDMFDLSGDPELQYRLMASCGLHGNVRHDWIAMPARGRSKSAVHEFLGQFWPEASEAELTLLLGQFTRESFIAFTRECGLSIADEKTALESYDRYTGRNAAKKKPKR